MTVWSDAPTDGDPGVLQLLDRLAQLVVGGADLEPEVVEAGAPARRRGRRRRTDLDEQQLVVGATAAERGGTREGGP